MIHTPTQVPRHIRRRASTLAAITVFLVPLVFTLVAAGLAAILDHWGVEAAEFGFGGLTFLTTFITVFTLPACLFAIPAMEIAIKFGKAGWLVAIISGVLVAVVLCVWLFKSDLNLVRITVFIGCGVFFGALFWLAARLSTPAAFVSDKAQKQA
ncbi:hypothetical protein BC777_2365 [Yoonia maricola]|uniref:Uncharacterized protein n=1 Tax=Yoonia maricola TaxID=420999 RepID=A0A2M8W517_9RHOB|nr:hypothetical protein BC777_2365 [Yoonia maricola]